MPLFYQRLASSKKYWSGKNGFLQIAWHAFHSIRKGKWNKVLGLVLRWILKRGSVSIVNVAVADYRAAQFLDEQRMKRCTSALHTGGDPVGGCMHFFGKAAQKNLCKDAIL
jgi:hypothetical protein